MPLESKDKPKQSTAGNETKGDSKRQVSAAPKAASVPVVETYYTILGVASDAKVEVIKQAYRKKAMVGHSDRGGSDAGFTKLHEAYTCLTDPNKRAAYDKKLADEQKRTAPKPKPDLILQLPSSAAPPSASYELVIFEPVTLAKQLRMSGASSKELCECCEDAQMAVVIWHDEVLRKRIEDYKWSGLARKNAELSKLFCADVENWWKLPASSIYEMAKQQREACLRILQAIGIEEKLSHKQIAKLTEKYKNDKEITAVINRSPSLVKKNQEYSQLDKIFKADCKLQPKEIVEYFKKINISREMLESYVQTAPCEVVLAIWSDEALNKKMFTSTWHDLARERVDFAKEYSQGPSFLEGSDDFYSELLLLHPEIFVIHQSKLDASKFKGDYLIEIKDEVILQHVAQHPKLAAIRNACEKLYDKEFVRALSVAEFVDLFQSAQLSHSENYLADQVPTIMVLAIWRNPKLRESIYYSRWPCIVKKHEALALEYCTAETLKKILENISHVTLMCSGKNPFYMIASAHKAAFLLMLELPMAEKFFTGHELEKLLEKHDGDQQASELINKQPELVQKIVAQRRIILGLQASENRKFTTELVEQKEQKIDKGKQFYILGESCLEEGKTNAARLYFKQGFAEQSVECLQKLVEIAYANQDVVSLYRYVVHYEDPVGEFFNKDAAAEIFNFLLLINPCDMQARYRGACVADPDLAFFMFARIGFIELLRQIEIRLKLPYVERRLVDHVKEDPALLYLLAELENHETTSDVFQVYLRELCNFYSCIGAEQAIFQLEQPLKRLLRCEELTDIHKDYASALMPYVHALALNDEEVFADLLESPWAEHLTPLQVKELVEHYQYPIFKETNNILVKYFKGTGQPLLAAATQLAIEEKKEFFADNLIKFRVVGYKYIGGAETRALPASMLLFLVFNPTKHYPSVEEINTHIKWTGSYARDFCSDPRYLAKLPMVFIIELAKENEAVCGLVLERFSGELLDKLILQHSNSEYTSVLAFVVARKEFLDKLFAYKFGEESKCEESGREALVAQGEKFYALSKSYADYPKLRWICWQQGVKFYNRACLDALLEAGIKERKPFADLKPYIILCEATDSIFYNPQQAKKLFLFYKENPSLQSWDSNYYINYRLACLLKEETFQETKEVKECCNLAFGNGSPEVGIRMMLWRITELFSCAPIPYRVQQLRLDPMWNCPDLFQLRPCLDADLLLLFKEIILIFYQKSQIELAEKALQALFSRTQEGESVKSIPAEFFVPFAVKCEAAEAEELLDKIYKIMASKGIKIIGNMIPVLVTTSPTSIGQHLLQQQGQKQVAGSFGNEAKSAPASSLPGLGGHSGVTPTSSSDRQGERVAPVRAGAGAGGVATSSQTTAFRPG